MQQDQNRTLGLKYEKNLGTSEVGIFLEGRSNE
jgi:hypothetical protein